MQRTTKVFLALSLAAISCLAEDINLSTLNIIGESGKGPKNGAFNRDKKTDYTINVNIDRLNLISSHFTEEFLVGAGIFDGNGGNKVNTNIKEAYVKNAQLDRWNALAWSTIDDTSGDSSSTLGIANVLDSDIGVIAFATAGTYKGNASASIEQLWLQDSTVNNIFLGAEAYVEKEDGNANANSGNIFVRNVKGDLKTISSIEDEDEEVEGGFFASKAESRRKEGKATASTSYLEISNSVLGNKDANFYGSYAEGNSDSTATTTKMIISDSNLTGDVYGAFADSGKAKTGALYLLDSKIDGDVYGAEGENGATAWVAAIGSKENLANNVISGDLIGAVSEDGDAKATVYLENYKVEGDVLGSLVYGNGNSNGNQIFLNDGTTINGLVAGAHLDGSGSSTNNIITINGNVDFAPTSEIWGAYAQNYNGKQDVFTGNTLNFFGSKGISVAKLGNFENYNFNLTNSKIGDLTDIKNTLITTKSIENQNGEDSTINVAMSKGQFNEINGKKIYLLNNEGGEIDAKAGRAKVGMFYRANMNLKADENGVYSAVVGTDGENNEGQSGLTASTNKVPTVEGALGGITNSENGGNSVNVGKDVFESPTELTANASDINRLQPINQGRLESLMLANVNADWANKAISGLRPLSVGEITPFGIIGGGHTKYKTGSGSNLKSNDFNFVVGTGYNFDNTIAGWFFEYGRGKYDSKNNYKADSDNDALKVKGKGTNYNYGIGLFTKTFISDAYVDASLHLGKAKVNFETSSYGEGFNPNYGFNTSYFGGHVGAGYILGNGEQNSFDTSIKYLYNQVGAKDKTINEDRFQFKREVSNRLQVGEQYKFQANEMLALKAGAAYEYEFSAKAKANTVDEFTGKKYDLKAQKVKGSTYIGELGVELTPFSDKKNSSIDLNAKGYGGKKQGASGNLVFKYTF